MIKTESIDGEPKTHYLSKDNAMANAMRLTRDEGVKEAIVVIHRRNSTIENIYLAGNHVKGKGV